MILTHHFIKVMLKNYNMLNYALIMIIPFSKQGFQL